MELCVSKELPHLEGANKHDTKAVTKPHYTTLYMSQKVIKLENIQNLIKSMNVFYTEADSVIATIHHSSPDLYCVPGAGLQIHHTAAGGQHHAIAAGGAVLCIVQVLTIEKEVCKVILPAVHIGIKVDGNPPCS